MRPTPRALTGIVREPASNSDARRQWLLNLLRMLNLFTTATQNGHAHPFSKGRHHVEHLRKTANCKKDKVRKQKSDKGTQVLSSTCFTPEIIAYILNASNTSPHADTPSSFDTVPFFMLTNFVSRERGRKRVQNQIGSLQLAVRDAESKRADLIGDLSEGCEPALEEGGGG